MSNVFNINRNETIEAERVAVLKNFDISDQGSIEGLDDLVKMISESLDFPTVLISLVEKENTCFIAKVGMKENFVSNQHSICHHTIKQTGILEIPNF